MKRHQMIIALLVLLMEGCADDHVIKPESQPTNPPVDYAIMGRYSGNILPGFVKFQNDKVYVSAPPSMIGLGPNNLPDLSSVIFHEVAVSDSIQTTLARLLRRIPSQLFTESTPNVGYTVFKNPDEAYSYFEVSIDGKTYKWSIAKSPNYLKDFMTSIDSLMGIILK